MCVCVEELRKQEEKGQLFQPILFVLLVLVSVLLYFAVSLMDPGFILSDDGHTEVMIYCREFDFQKFLIFITLTKSNSIFKYL